jgi:heme exporter protein A
VVVTSADLIETRGLTKHFGLKPVLRGVDLAVGPGECVALLGPNGAGKTTLLRILSGLARPTSGAARVAGHRLPDQAGGARGRLGVVSHQTLLYPDLSAEENLRFYARLYDLPQPSARIAAVLEQVGLTARRRDPVRTFSRGMQQRLAIGRAILHDPDVLLFDEPYTGLDPAAGALLDEVLRGVAVRRRAVLFTTHDLPRALALADRVLILARGRIAHATSRAEIDAAGLAVAYERVVN